MSLSLDGSNTREFRSKGQGVERERGGGEVQGNRQAKVEKERRIRDGVQRGKENSAIKRSEKISFVQLKN